MTNETETERAFDPAGWDEADVGAIDDVPEGGVKRFTVEDRPFAVFRLDGELYAYRDACPHQGASISCGIITGAMLESEPEAEPVFALEGRVVSCPRHRWKFKIETGETLYGTDRRRLLGVPARVEDGRVLIGFRRRARVAAPVTASTQNA
jgi:nitrite reductase/ring-hydroxylating ferredoxin subunit